MAESNEFKSIVLRAARKKLVYDRANRRLEYERSLSKKEIDSLIRLGISQYGYTNEVLLNRLIDDIASADQDGPRETPATLSIGGVAPGDIVVINYGSDSRLTLLALTRGSMICLSDNNGDLLYGDQVELLSLDIERGHPAYMRITRNMLPYPDGDSCYCIDRVGKIEVIRNECSLNTRSAAPAAVRHEPGVKKLYALKAGKEHYFLFSDITVDEDSALFEIDLGSMTYQYNPKFKVPETVKEEIISELRKVCECSREIDNLLRLRNHTPGRLRYRHDGGNILLQIVEKLRIELI